MTDPALSSPIAVAVHVQEAERPRCARDDAAGGAACRSRAAFRPPNLTGLTVRAVRRTIAADRKEANMAEVDNDAAAELCWKLLLPVLSWPACGGKRTSSRFAA